MKHAVLVTVTCIVLQGCGLIAIHGAPKQTPEQREAEIQQYIAQRTAESDERNKCRENGARIGMKADDVLRVSCWSQPSRMNKTRRASGTYEQWVYERPRAYLYFENDVLYAIQD